MNSDATLTHIDSLIPRGGDEGTYMRRNHLDLPLPAEVAWAETKVLADWLAVAVFSKQRPRVFHTDASGEAVTDQDWVRGRLRRLQQKRAA